MPEDDLEPKGSSAGLDGLSSTASGEGGTERGG